MRSDEIRSVIREIVTMLGEVKTKSGEKVAEYGDGCLMFWVRLKNMGG